MKFLNKIDQYLIENHPLIWMTKLHYVLPIGLLINLGFYIWGFQLITAKMITGYIGHSLFEKSYAIFMYLLVGFVFIILWAFAYFKKSAVRHLYPIGKFYFIRLFACLFLIFFVIVSPYLSFTAGSNAKTQSLADYDQLSEEVQMVNLAQAFLPTSSGLYTYDHLFSLENPEYEIQIQEDWVNTTVKESGYDPFAHPENNDTLLSGEVVQAVKYEEVFPEGMEPIQCIQSRIPIPEILLEMKCNVNYYTNEFILVDRFKDAPDRRDYYYYYENIYKNSRELNDQIRAISGNKDKIKKLLVKYDEFLTEHEIPHAFNSDVIATYFVKHKGEFRNSFVARNLQFYRSFIEDEYQHNKLEAIRKFTDKSKIATVNTLENAQGDVDCFFVEEASVKSVFQNSKTGYYWPDKYFICMVFLIIAAAWAFIFLLFSFADFITLIVTIPITGVLIIINVVICVFLDSIIRDDDYLLFVPMIFSTAIIIVYLIMLKSKRSSRKITNVMGYITGLISSMYLLGLFVVIILSTMTKYPVENYYETRYIFLQNWIEDPGFVFTLSAIGILLYTLTIKKLIAKPD